MTGLDSCDHLGVEVRIQLVPAIDTRYLSARGPAAVVGGPGPGGGSAGGSGSGLQALTRYEPPQQLYNGQQAAQQQTRRLPVRSAASAYRRRSAQPHPEPDPPPPPALARAYRSCSSRRGDGSEAGGWLPSGKRPAQYDSDASGHGYGGWHQDSCGGGADCPTADSADAGADQGLLLARMGGEGANGGEGAEPLHQPLRRSLRRRGSPSPRPCDDEARGAATALLALLGQQQTPVAGPDAANGGPAYDNEAGGERGSFCAETPPPDGGLRGLGEPGDDGELQSPWKALTAAAAFPAAAAAAEAATTIAVYEPLVLARFDGSGRCRSGQWADLAVADGGAAPGVCGTVEAAMGPGKVPATETMNRQPSAPGAIAPPGIVLSKRRRSGDAVVNDGSAKPAVANTGEAAPVGVTTDGTVGTAAGGGNPVARSWGGKGRRRRQAKRAAPPTLPSAPPLPSLVDRLTPPPPPPAAAPQQLQQESAITWLRHLNQLEQLALIRQQQLLVQRVMGHLQQAQLPAEPEQGLTPPVQQAAAVEPGACGVEGLLLGGEGVTAAGAGAAAAQRAREVREGQRVGGITRDAAAPALAASDRHLAPATP
ncbi:hypothetical protein GPECTOR_1g739 [Gonium pectorale]|uniref:Uncharacterized protein n=1 Tax=Gonium pectorale TaxID=33097 RepID=A0A150H5C2_GONPE|nr:hypothetical protein GPECTOR_1g739 [Gonium pectorale]|eukprot:KXZ56820.1 hypothetical protein GPECTOR_1g739 [Gonium pectorale]